METRAWSNEDLDGCHVSLFSPDQVPRMDKQTFPSSYKFGFTRPFPFVQLIKNATGGVCGKLASNIQSMTNGASSYGVFSE